MNIFYVIHCIGFILLLLLPFFPLNLIKKTYIYFLPMLISFLWIIFKGCPINQLHKDETPDNSFLKNILAKYNIIISDKLSARIMVFIFISIPTLILFRLYHFNK